MATRAEKSSEMIDKLLDAVYRWENKVAAFTATGDPPDDDIVLTHDGRGRLIGCDIRLVCKKSSPSVSSRTP